jgi:hypothetical protein
MTSEILDPVSDKAAWWHSSNDADWHLSPVDATLLPPDVSQTGGLKIEAHPRENSDPPSMEHQFTPAQDLRNWQELRFWFSSNRIATGRSEHPFYLAIELSNAGATWERWLPIGRPNHWELQQLWLEDMDPNLRQSVATIRLRALARELTFTAQVGDLLAVTPQPPIQEVEDAFLSRLNNQFQVPAESANAPPIEVPAIWELPEVPDSKEFPSIVMIPWSVQPKGELGGSVDVIDNYSANGAYIHPIPKRLQLEYAIDVVAKDRTAKAMLLDAILADFTRTPYFIFDGQRVSLIPFMPSPEQLAESISPGRAPLFFQLTVPIEAGQRQFQPSIRSATLTTGYLDPKTRLRELDQTLTL